MRKCDFPLTAYYHWCCKMSIEIRKFLCNLQPPKGIHKAALQCAAYAAEGKYKDME